MYFGRIIVTYLYKETYMYKVLALLLLIVASCSGNRNEPADSPSSDTLMDSVQIKQKADSTIQRLDHLQDSVEKLREQAAEKAGN